MAGVTTVMDFPFLDLDRAGSWEEFNGGLKRYSGPGQNFVYADIDGNIGYHAAGALPVREGCMGDVPADGSREECEWTGLIPFDDLPQAYNPPSGMIVSANQNPFPAGYRYPVNGFFAAPYRAHGIRTRLQAHEKWKPEEMLAIQKDVYSAIGHFLAQQAVKAFDQKHPAESQLRDAAELLRPWNGQMEKGTAAPLLVALLIPQLQKAIAQSAAPGAGDEDISAVSLPAVERLLTQRPPSWFDDYDQTLLNCLKRAIQEGEKVQGSKISRWDYGQWIELRILNPVAGQLPLLGKYFNIGPVPMSGSSTSIKQTTRRLGPSMRMVVDFADLDHSLANITIGESGHLLSGHYRDQWRAYYGGTSFPMQFDKVDARRTLTVIPR
jgi:penicillin amidase